MPASQFTIFSSSDVGGPGLLTGQAGSLLTLLDACLVTGYSGHSVSPAWTKPFANSGNIGCYKQGAGAGLGLVVNDNGPGAGTYQEASAIGWESVAGIGSPVGTGSGQFPTPAQQLTNGHVIWRKSVAASSAGRTWLMAADSSTFYLWISTGDAAGVYYPAMFGDVFSLKGGSDAYRCFIIGRFGDNTTGGGDTSKDTSDGLVVGATGSSNAGPLAFTQACGHFMARTWGGGGSSIVFVKLCDQSKMVGAPSGSTPLLGLMQTPNGPDAALYLSPLVVGEPASLSVRGRLRGLYQVCHPIAGFADGQTVAGGGDYAGKSFQIVLKGPSGGFWAVETSATVETN